MVKFTDHDPGADVSLKVLCEARRFVEETKPVEEEILLARIKVVARIKKAEDELKKQSEDLDRKIEERKQAEEALRVSEGKYRDLVENIHDVIYQTDADGIIQYISPAITVLFGYEPETMAGQRFTQFLYDADVGMYKEYFGIARSGFSGSIELRIMTASFDIRWIHFSCHSILAKGQFAGTRGVISDITERKQAEETLQDSEKRLSSFMDSATDGFILFDSELNYIEMNTAALDMANLDRKDVIGKNILDVVPNIKETGRYDKYKEVIETGEPFFMFDLVPHPKFGQKHLEIKAFKVGGGLGNIFTDITERKRAEEALRESEQRFRAISDNLPTGQIYQLMAWPDGISRFTYVGGTVEKLHECTAEQAISDPSLLFDRVVEEDREGLRLATEKSIREMDVFDHELRIRRKSGEVRWHRITSRPRLTTDNIVVFDGIDMDITERKQAEMALSQTLENLQQAELKLQIQNEELRNTNEELLAIQDQLRTSHESYVSLYDFAPLGYFSIDQDGVIQEANMTICQQLGVDRSALIKMRFYDLIVKEERDKIFLHLRQLFETKTRQICEIQLLKQDGSQFYAQLESIIPAQLEGTIKHCRTAVSDITERKQAEKELRKYEHIISVTKVHMLFLDRDYAHQAVNESYLRAHRKLRKEIIGQSVSDLIGRNVFEQLVKEKLDRCLGGEEIHYQTWFEFPGLGRRYMDVVYYPYFETSRIVSGVIVSSHDITELCQVEDALRKSEEKYRLLFETMVSGFALLEMIYDKHDRPVDCRYLVVNPAHERLTGLKTTEILGRTARESIPGLEDKWIENYGQVDRTGESMEIENYVKGLKRWYRVFAYRPKPGSVAVTFDDVTERKQVEEALKNERDRAQLYLDIAGVMFVALNNDGNIMLINKRGCEILKYKEDDLIGKDWIETCLPKKIRGEIKNDFNKLVTGAIEPVEYYENSIISSTGEERLIAFHNALIRNQSSEISGVLFSGEDITERKQAEETICKLNEELERKVIQRTQELGERVRELNCLYGISKFIEKSDASLEEIFQETVNLMPPSWQYSDITCARIIFEGQVFQTDNFEETIWKLASDILDKGDRIGSLEIYYLEERQVNDEGLFLKEEQNLIEAVTERLGTVVERKRAEEALLNSEKRFRKMIEKSPFPMVIIGANQDMEYFNDKFIELFGYTLKDVSTAEQCWQTAYPDENYRRSVQQSWIDAIEYAIVNDTEIEMQEWDITIKNGTKRHCEFYMVPLDEFSLIMMNDITENIKIQTELKKAKEAAETANKAKSAFLANMSHELRTPLNAILGFTQLMMRDSAFLPSQREKLEIIIRSGEHLLMLINDILDMSKIEAGRSILRNRSFDLFHTLTNIEEMIGVRADSKNLKFNVLCDNGVPRYIKGDDRKLRQVLINLLNNAVKFTEKGSVSLQISSSGLKIHFKIEDTGVGIAPSDLKAVFDVFERTQSGSRSDEGTGLGLAISRKLVRLMGGDITVASEVGKGSVFTFDIAAEPADAAQIGVKSSVRKVIGLEPDQETYLILIVEDKWENRAFLAQLLQSAGFAVREAVNGQEAIEMIAKEQPHLIFMDMRMPVLDGFEATRKIKATPQGLEIPVIAMTASAFEEDKSAILAAGCDEFIRKPAHDAKIFEAVKRHLRVRYIYDEPAEREDVRKVRTDLTPADLDTLPAEWMAEFSQAVVRGYRKPILELIKQIRPEEPAIAEALVKLTRDFRFDKLIALTGSPAKHCR